MGFSPPISARVLRGLLVICMVSLVIALSANGDEDNHDVKRADFSKDFAFGASTAAAEIEGSTTVDGRGPSVWDEYIAQYPERIVDGSNISIAIDSYRRYKEDVQRLVELGVEYYRFSISWTRILPDGSLSGGIKQEGIDHYNSLIDELVKYGIKPVVTLLHFDFPQALQEKYGGFLSRRVVKDFKDYSEICFKTFGDRVQKWITINEPYIISFAGHDVGSAPPGRCSPPDCPAGNSSTEPYIVTHNILLAHATVYKLYRQKFQAKQGGQIGMSHVGQYAEPYSKSIDDIAAARRVLDFTLGWFVEPLVFGQYPKSMRDLVKERLPKITKAEKNLLKGSLDFIGINYYTSRYAKNVNRSDGPPRYSTDYLANLTDDRDGLLIGQLAEGNAVINIYPQGLQKLVEVMNQTYQHPTIYITENGYADANVENRTLDVALNDEERISYIKSHLHYILKAIKNGVNVMGYFYWNLFDDFEWGDGYQSRFGFFYIDYKNNLTRIPKKSTKWFNGFLHG